MSWGEVKKINSDLSTTIDKLIKDMIPKRLYIYNNLTYVVPYNTGLTIRACGKGGVGSNGYGGGGAGYCKDYREYKKGDIINISITNNNMSVVCTRAGLSLLANAGNGSTGGTASGGNLINATGGNGGSGGGSSSSSSKGIDSLQGCGGGGGGTYYYSCSAGGNGGFSGGQGGNGIYQYHIEATSGNGGDGGFSGGAGGVIPVTSNTQDKNMYGGNGGSSQYGIGGAGGYVYATKSSASYKCTSGNGGNGAISGGLARVSTGTNTVNGNNGITYGNYLYIGVPKLVNHGGGAGGYAMNVSYGEEMQGGVACCIITIGEDTEPF